MVKIGDQVQVKKTTPVGEVLLPAIVQFADQKQVVVLYADGEREAVRPSRVLREQHQVTGAGPVGINGDGGVASSPGYSSMRPMHQNTGTFEGKGVIKYLDERFTNGDLNLLRQWFNALQDTNPKYLEEADRDLMKKIKSALGPEYLHG